MRYFLDTTFLIDYLRGNPAATSRFATMFEDGDQLFVNEIVACELAAGSRHDPDPVLEALLEPLEFLQPGPETAVLAGRWRRAASRAGRTLSLADALIAAAAVHGGATVLTRNARDFSLTPTLVAAY